MWQGVLPEQLTQQRRLPNRRLVRFLTACNSTPGFNTQNFLALFYEPLLRNFEEERTRWDHYRSLTYTLTHAYGKRPHALLTPETILNVFLTDPRFSFSKSPARFVGLKDSTIDLHKALKQHQVKSLTGFINLYTGFFVKKGWIFNNLFDEYNYIYHLMLQRIWPEQLVDFYEKSGTVPLLSKMLQLQSCYRTVGESKKLFYREIVEIPQRATQWFPPIKDFSKVNTRSWFADIDAEEESLQKGSKRIQPRYYTFKEAKLPALRAYYTNPGEEGDLSRRKLLIGLYGRLSTKLHQVLAIQYKGD